MSVHLARTYAKKKLRATSKYGALKQTTVVSESLPQVKYLIVILTRKGMMEYEIDNYAGY